MDHLNSLTTSSYMSRFISILFHFYTIIESTCKYIMSVILYDNKTESKLVNHIDVLATTEVSQKYWFLENVLKLEEEINRNIGLIGEIFSKASEYDEVRLAAGIELSKSKMLKKGKLKMFRNLCLVALKEIPPIEGDKEVTIDDLEGFWCLLGIEADKHRQTVIEIMKPKPIINKSGKGDAAVPVKTIKPTSSSKVCKKPTTSEMKATMKINKSNIDERNRKYMERMKNLRERKAKPLVKVQDKENQNPNPITVKSPISKEEFKLKQSDKVLSPRIQWQI